jgi:hypothetical protein
MAVLASDDFDRADGALGANWEGVFGGAEAFTVGSNVAVNSVATGGGATYTAVAAPNDQYAECKITTVTADIGCGPGVRMSVSTAFGYYVEAYSAGVRLRKLLDGTTTTIGTAAGGISANDVVRVEAQGTNITVKVNGATVIGPISDSDIASGSWGIFGESDIVSELHLDDWAGGDFTTASVPETDHTTSHRPFNMASGRM